MAQMPLKKGGVLQESVCHKNGHRILKSSIAPHTRLAIHKLIYAVNWLYAQ